MIQVLQLFWLIPLEPVTKPFPMVAPRANHSNDNWSARHKRVATLKIAPALTGLCRQRARCVPPPRHDHVCAWNRTGSFKR
jgi:hypothetical protein